MGQKTHPTGFRLGGVIDWQSQWYANNGKSYANLLNEDRYIRDVITKELGENGAISKIEIERGSQDISITVYTARPGIIIGRGGTRVEELKKFLEEKTNNTVRLNINEIRVPELVAKLVGENIAEQLERRVAFRRAVNTAMQRTMQVGAGGIKVVISGRLAGADIARTEKYMQGRVPLHTLRADIDYEISEANTTYGVIGIKVWIYKGDIIPTAENLLAIKTARIERNEQQGDNAPQVTEG
ncbi:MAG: 30S ribosomal protein S3 [SAR202 cluster bacterium]|jgi:small subunit ribosomal protein S3|nr:30S ribosomal protein S3 [Chloroflexota bacterium]MQF84024.1 30S ribosomal protein S3 [SAR202 cluster bacterium]MEC7919453.1 30S ribosomal protein S3 [Chloroflexota bacterium]MEC9107428.1 30S ribosomal protein S3 [Chloroflexota bacterium]MQG19605.1 30S ribosomal protein S3 [SAR202 cluster bacterium]|tara:strand:+ start:22454 stop:23176 length:723 start_codon:yes stop_codon:yes gene_type:complete